jgi:membrane-associated protease RseP (regulator of RpoE activity)
MHEPTVAEQDALQSLVAQQNRLDRVAAPLLVNNPAICKDNARNLLGFTAKNKYSYSEELSSATQQALGLNERLQVVHVLAGSGAARAGVHKGDGLVAVDDQPLPQGPHAERQAAAIIGPLVTGKQSVKLTVARNGANIALNVPLTLACAFSVELGNSDNVNAYSDGRRIVVTRGMMRFAQNDNELAYVLAKEMAHNVLGQQAKQHISGTMGDIIDNLVLLHPDMSTMNGMAGIRPYTPELDASADNLSLYMAARGGYSVDGAPRFWQRLAQQYPASVLNGYTAIHPMTQYRLSAMDRTVVELKGKQAAGKPLMPVS